jgi:hypothetical protein
MTNSLRPENRFEPVLLFGSIAFFYLLIGYLSNTMIFTEDFYMNAWSENFSVARIQKLIEFNKRWTWLVYLLTPLLLFIKMSVITLMLQARLFLNESSYSFKKVFRIVLMAELIPLGYAIIQFGYFIFVHPHSFEDINAFAPLSVVSLMGAGNLPGYLSYPLQYITLFEIAYWLILAAGLRTYQGNTFTKSIQLVASSYGIGLLLWMIAIMFIQLQSS